MRSTFILSSVALFISFFAAAQPTSIGGTGKETVDKIIGQVGDNIILLSEVKNEVIQSEINGEGLGNNAKCSIFEDMMYQKLLLNQAQLDSIVINDEQVNANMENRLRTIEAQIGSREKLEEFYGKTYAQIKDEFREIIRERMMAEEMERQITANIVVTPREIEKFYNSIPKDSLPYINQQIALQQIVVYPEITTEDKAKTIAELNKWRDEIINGKKRFELMAKIYSEDPGSAQKGGLLEASKGMMVKPFEAAAMNLKPGEISEVFETEYGFHIVQLIERKGNDYTCRHILRIPEVSNESITKAAEVIDECYQRLQRAEISWDEAVKLYSEDKETKQNHGNVTNPYTGDIYWDVQNINQIDPQIFTVIQGLKVGQYTQPGIYINYQSRKEGVRIVRLADQTKPHVANLEDDYAFVKKAAQASKEQEVIGEWVEESIEKAYIKIDPDFKSCNLNYNW
ncbi:peptidylprolyl isomerase [Lishizhenia sp.]|uniref:peptidylprolyl isomerase n=1 Tax=Lishizhenia sp. TaxID=2497594 RepID=UPI00299D4A03|nr:peptidylprolyl isomerase [Lishizhenia sp.]MDX1445642.1 peptidylprolyl isomerase [Lishizhenia sp.]